MLQSTGSQRVRHNWATEQNRTELVLEIWNYFFIVKNQCIKCMRQEGKFANHWKFCAADSTAGALLGSVSCGFQLLLNLLPQLALGCPHPGGAERGGLWGWGDGLSGSRRVLVWLMGFHFLGFFLFTCSVKCGWFVENAQSQTGLYCLRLCKG